MRGSLRSSSCRQARSVPTDSPPLAAHTSTPASATDRHSATSPAKSKLPGASSTLILQPLYSTGATAAEMEIWRLISSGS